MSNINTKPSIFFVGFLLIISVLGCNKGNTSNLDKDINRFFPFGDVNTSIKLSIVDDCPNGRLEINHSFCFDIENESQNTIRFPADSSLKLYMFEEGNNSWIEIQDKVEVLDKEFVLYPKGGDDIWNYLRYIHPELSASDIPVTIRIVLIGQVEGGDKRLVGAYLDVILQPEGGATTGSVQWRELWQFHIILQM